MPIFFIKSRANYLQVDNFILVISENLNVLFVKKSDFFGSEHYALNSKNNILCCYQQFFPNSPRSPIFAIFADYVMIQNDSVWVHFGSKFFWLNYLTRTGHTWFQYETTLRPTTKMIQNDSILGPFWVQYIMVTYYYAI